MIQIASFPQGLDTSPAYNLNASEQPCSEDPLSYDIMRYPVTVGRSVHQPERISVRDVAYVMDAIETGFYEGYNLKKATELIRSTTNREQRRHLKEKQPWFCGSLCLGRRANANVKQAWMMVFDLDHIGVANSGLPQPNRSSATPDVAAQAQAIEAIKALAISKLPYVRYAFRSVVDGAKLVVQLTKPITSEAVYRKVYVYLALQIEWALKHVCDATPDWARACFLCHDPLLLHNHHCMPLDPQVCYKQAVSISELVFPKVGSVAEPTKNIASACDTTPIASPYDTTNDYAKAETIIAVLSQITMYYADWVKAGMALYAGFGEAGKPLWDMFVANPNYHDDQRVIDTVWHHCRSVRSITLASLFYLADKYGIKYE